MRLPELPELPEPSSAVFSSVEGEQQRTPYGGYSTDQMIAYGHACTEAMHAYVTDQDKALEFALKLQPDPDGALLDRARIAEARVAELEQLLADQHNRLLEDYRCLTDMMGP